MGRRTNAEAGTGDRSTVASRHSFIPLSVQKTKSRKAQEKRQEEKNISFVRCFSLEGCPECIPPGDDQLLRKD